MQWLTWLQVLDGSLQWLCDYVRTGKMPTRGLIPDAQITVKQRGWGTVELVGVKERSVHLPFIRPLQKSTAQDFFKLPQELEEAHLQRVQRLQTALENMHKTPQIYYGKRTKKSAGLSATSANDQHKVKKKLFPRKNLNVILSCLTQRLILMMMS